MTEKVITFGKERNLVGVLTTNGAPPGATRAPAILLLNSGLIHRVGPFRMAVDLARRLARLGFDVLRYDQSGLGDSNARANQPAYEQRAVEDAAEAMELLSRTRGHERFVLVGLCSGAANAHLIAAGEPRVAGAVFIDGHAVRTPQFHLRRVGYRAMSPLRWANAARRQLARVPGLGAHIAAPPTRTGRAADDREALFEMTDVPEAQLVRDYGELARRQVKMLFVFTSSADDRYNSEGQLFEASPQLATVAEVAFYPLADHTFTLLAHRHEFYDRVIGWAQRTFL